MSTDEKTYPLAQITNKGRADRARLALKCVEAIHGHSDEPVKDLIIDLLHLNKIETDPWDSRELLDFAYSMFEGELEEEEGDDA